MNISWDLFIPLLAGHIIGDFWLQTDIIISNREHSIRWLFFHTGIVALTTWVIVGDFANVGIILSVFLAHLIIDGGKKIFKIFYSKELGKENIKLIIIDQLF